jgi:hypothetical protein
VLGLRVPDALVAFDGAEESWIFVDGRWLIDTARTLFGFGGRVRGADVRERCNGRGEVRCIAQGSYSQSDKHRNFKSPRRGRP